MSRDPDCIACKLLPFGACDFHSRDEELLRAVASSLCIRFGTTAPYAIGRVTAEKVGFAAIPSVVVDVYCRQEDVGSLVPIVRQRVFGELAERGWENETIGFTPSVRLESHRRRRFVDENEDSSSLGENKFGHHHRFRFDIVDVELREATFNPVRGGTFALLPDRREAVV